MQISISTDIFFFIFLYNFIIFILFYNSVCTGSDNSLFIKFKTAYIFNLVISASILFFTLPKWYNLNTLLGGMLLASYMWLFPISLSLYRQDGIPQCLKNLAISTLVFCILFIILIPIAIIFYNDSLKASVINGICGDEGGQGCINKIKEYVESKKQVKKQEKVINTNIQLCDGYKDITKRRIEVLNEEIIKNNKSIQKYLGDLNKYTPAELKMERYEGTINLYKNSIPTLNTENTKITKDIDEYKELLKQLETGNCTQDIFSKIDNKIKTVKQ